MALGLALATTACTTDGMDEEGFGVATSEVSVSTYTTSTCSTSVVLGLSKQIADEVGCMNPGSLVRFSPTTNLQLSSNAVLPYLSAKGKTDLEAVASTRVVQINSAFRTVAQQYLLYRWYQLGRCGISAAATPGRSNHESGRALDLGNYSVLVSAMAARNWSHDVPGDPVHFDHLSSPDIRGRDVLAFQRLWNRNNPGDIISEDGLYGPQTESRLRASPATGFSVGATCIGRVQGADVLMVEGPDKLAPGAKGHYSITVENTGTVDWPATTRLVVAGGGTSQLYDAATWVSPSEIGTIDSDIGAGAMGILDIDVLAPTVTEETPVFTQLALIDPAGGASMGTINLALTVTPNGDEDTSADSSDEHDDGAAPIGGCSAGGHTGWAAGLLLALVGLRRRRR
ncbi:MAG TPA: M15 family metallopeptidase [Kofleriaceae bacterium]|nr:M15 family metallopeptidase [Kofleriaceae bacterium]